MILTMALQSLTICFDKLLKLCVESCENSLLRDVAIRLDSLTHIFEKHQTESNVVLKNASLRQENRSLTKDLDRCKCIVSELNQKLTNAENDKASLLPAIRPLNEGRVFTQQIAPLIQRNQTK